MKKKHIIFVIGLIYTFQSTAMEVEWILDKESNQASQLDISNAQSSNSNLSPQAHKMTIDLCISQQLERIKLNKIRFDLYRSVATGDTLLHVAVRYHSPDSIELIFKYINQFKDMPVKEIIDLRIFSEEFFSNKQHDSGKVLELRNKAGNTALHLAMKFSDIISTKLLLSKEANIRALNNKNQTPFDLAHPIFIRRLIKDGIIKIDKPEKLEASNKEKDEMEEYIKVEELREIQRKAYCEALHSAIQNSRKSEFDNETFEEFSIEMKNVVE